MEIVNSEPTLEEALEAIARRLPWGYISFASVMQMVLGEESEVVTTVSREADAGTERIPGEGIKTEKIKVSAMMVACLSATEGEFKIRGDSGDIAPGKKEDQDWFVCRQKRVLDESTNWVWHVTPLVTGDRQLHLTAHCRVEAKGRLHDCDDVQARHRKVRVHSNTSHTLRQFFSGNSGMIVSVLAATGLFAGLGALLKNKVQRWFTRKRRPAGFHRD